MKNRLIRSLVCALVCLSVLVPVLPHALSEQVGGTLDSVEWNFTDGVMTLRGEDGILTGPNRPWDYYKSKTTELVIGSAFSDHRDWSGYAGLDALESVIFETDYCSACFSDSRGLDAVRYKGEHPVFMGMAFVACRLKNIVFDSPEADYVFNGRFLMNRAGTELFYCLGSVKGADLVIPEGVEVIHEGAFARCSIGSVTLPSTLRVIEGYAFYGVTQLKEITIPASCREIGMAAFAESTLRNVTFLGDSIDFSADSYGFKPGKFVRRGGLTFDMCKSLQSIVVPACGEVPFGLFRNCSGLRRIEFLEGTTRINSFSGIFENCGKVTVLILPDDVYFDRNVLREMKNPIIWCHADSLAAGKVTLFKLKHKFIGRE